MIKEPTRTRKPVELPDAQNPMPVRGRKPPWLRVRLPTGEAQAKVREMMRSKKLHTICEEAHCPNIGECWGRGTATFLILGDVCTRSCRFCAVKRGRPETIDWTEPLRVAQAVANMKLRHAVITSVNRDELPDGGAAVYAETIRQIRQRAPKCTIELLIPDFLGDRESLAIVMDAKPEILGHNVETAPRLYRYVRPQAKYQRSLEVLRMAKDLDPTALTKSGIMVGLGENRDEIEQVMADLRSVEVDIMTIGQYLRPTETHLTVVRYWTPEEFAELKDIGYAAGFRWVESGPLVRSSYRAEQQARELRVAPAEAAECAAVD